MLTALGFEVLGVHDDLFYNVQQPKGWDKSTHGWMTQVVDTEGNVRISQFFKGASYDKRDSLDIIEQEE